MKSNWKVWAAAALIVATVVWAFTSINPQAYSGKALNFAVGGGPITVTNPSSDTVPAQFMGATSRSFTVISSIEGFAGASVREGTGSSATHSIQVELPPGTSEFTMTRGSDVSFVADTDTTLSANVQPQTSGQQSTTLLMAGVVILGSLYYISRADEHRLFNKLRGKKPIVQDLRPIPTVNAGGQGQAARTYGDNRAVKAEEGS